MMGEGPISMEQMTVVLDNAPVAVYVSALDSWELIYANRMARDLMLRQSDAAGLTCYQAAGYDRPCPFCQAGKMNRDELRVREFRHPICNRVYRLSGKLIDWGGRPAHIEYIVDITDKKKAEEQEQARRQELLATFKSIPCGLCVYRYDGERIRPLFHNPAFYEITGYSDAHIQLVEAETDFLGVHPEDVGPLQKRVGEAIRQSGLMQWSYRLWNDQKEEYRWIHLDVSVKSETEGTKLLYAVYSDISEQVRLEKELIDANEKMQDIVNAIPGGVAIYKVTDIFETVYFSDGVPELTGYTVEEYREQVRQDAANLIYREDVAMATAKAREAIRTRRIARFEFRKQHRDGHIVWVRAQVKWIGEEDGSPLIHCVFHNISDLKEAQLEMDHLVNSIPGGIASYRVENGRFLPVFFSDGVTALTGHTREEYEVMVRENALNVIYPPDRKRVLAAAQKALDSGGVLDASYRMRHKDGSLIWIHLNGRRMGPPSEVSRFYAVFTGMSAETRIFQSIANETADGIYVIDRETHDLLYVNESKNLFTMGQNCVGQKCYAALHGRDVPCEFCNLSSYSADGEEHEMEVAATGRFYSTRFRATDWNGIPAYVQYVRDVTGEVKTRREKERLEQYFQTLVKRLPGGVAVVRREEDGSLIPEFMSDGFAALTDMPLEDAWDMYRKDSLAGVHPDDRAQVRRALEAYVADRSSHCEIEYRLRTGSGGYVWVKNTFALTPGDGRDMRIYSFYRDVTKEREEQEQLRQQYQDLIFQHYHIADPNVLIVGHCNITQNCILEIIDHTDSDLLQTFGTVREDFFVGLSGLVTDEAERQVFLATYQNQPALAAFERGDFEQRLECFIKLPKEARGRYVQIQMSMVTTPDTGDITGILTITDVTEQAVADRVMHRLSVTGYDFVVDLDLTRDRYKILSSNENVNCLPLPQGGYSEWSARVLRERVVPRDRKAYERGMDPDYMLERLQSDGAYTFSFSLAHQNGDVRTKSMTVSAVDLRLGRVCLTQTDITDSVREQQGLLYMIAYTFELAGFIDAASGRLILYTRQTVLENLSPYIVEDYNASVERLVGHYDLEEGEEEARRQFRLDTMLERLRNKPEGYDFVLPYRSGEEERYKQVNVLWGDENHRTICMVRADVTDVLAAERQTKKTLEKTLALVEEASRAKSDFLSAMSHDIRTPMNAIMGMTALAVAHQDDRERVADCLQKISVSSRHLLSLINDVLDMSKIERSQIALNRMKITLPELTEQLSAIMAPQARAAGLRFEIQTEGIRHGRFYGDALRLNQIFINLLSNAIKFTEPGGRVDFRVEELDPPADAQRARYRFTVRDTGMGMTEEFQAHLFEPFARSRSAAQIEGTGLGLSITKGLIDLMNGTISVASREHQGAAFQVELECDLADDDEAPDADTEAEPGDPAAGQAFSG